VRAERSPERVSEGGTPYHHLRLGDSGWGGKGKRENQWKYTKIFAPQTPQKWGVFSHFLKIYGENLGVS
jgi:hypothetical protein